MNKLGRKSYYEKQVPSLLVPDHCMCSQATTMVALYDEPLGEGHETITLLFPGNLVGAPPRQVTTQRKGMHSIVFSTPIYSTSRGQVEVSPLLIQRNGAKLPLGKFRLTLKHSVTTVMELCMKLSSSGAILPVLTTLMLNADTEKDHFKDPHTDRAMTLLVGSMKPGTGCTIKDILLPPEQKKWRKKHLTDLARKYGLRNMEKEAFMMTARSKPTSLRRRETMSRQEDRSDEGADPTTTYGDPFKEQSRLSGMTGSFSSPALHMMGLESDDEPEQSVRGAEGVTMTKQMQNDEKRVFTVVCDHRSRDPGKLNLRVGQLVYVVTGNCREPGWWYGACEGKHGSFPSYCVEATYTKKEARKLPLPPLPGREPLPIGWRASMPQAEVRLEDHRMRHILGKQYKRYDGTSDSSTSRDLSSAGSFTESGDYVDMVAHTVNSTEASEDENDSPFHTVDDRQQIPVPTAKEQRSVSPNKPASQPAKRTHVPTQGATHLRPQTHVQRQESGGNRRSRIAPQPPRRTTSIKNPDRIAPIEPQPTEVTHQATGIPEQSDLLHDDPEDQFDYVNLDEQGLPLAQTISKRMHPYVNFGQEVVGGHEYELTEPFKRDAATASSPQDQHERVFHLAHQEFVDRKQERIRRTHETVLKKGPPATRPKPSYQVSGDSPTGEGRVNKFMQQLESRIGQNR